MLPDDFQDLEYQRQAVIAARKIPDAHNGVFLADVVGLGKTFIASMLLQKPAGPQTDNLPACFETLLGRSAPGHFMFIRSGVVSSGKLPEITDYAKYSYIVVDESHRFRNEKTQSYELLKKFVSAKSNPIIRNAPE